MKKQIIDILTELRPEFDFSQDVNFIEDGMLDSFDIVSLVDSIEKEFNIAINGMDIIPENFCSIEAIENIINANKK